MGDSHVPPTRKEPSRRLTFVYRGIIPLPLGGDIYAPAGGDFSASTGGNSWRVVFGGRKSMITTHITICQIRSLGLVSTI